MPLSVKKESYFKRGCKELGGWVGGGGGGGWGGCKAFLEGDAIDAMVTADGVLGEQNLGIA